MAAATAEPQSALADDPPDLHRLANELAHAIRGEVRFSAGSRALYANDASVYRQVPLGVVVPRTIDDIVATMELCRSYRVPIVARGCGTGLAGQMANEAVKSSEGDADDTAIRRNF